MNTRTQIGIDFDNTLITYDDVFCCAAPFFTKIGTGVGPKKRDIRDYLRSLPDGEVTWQRLQGYVYGKGISSAKMFDGAGQFLRRCHAENYNVLIISHKTEFGHFDPDRVNLRDAALSWMQAQGFFCEDGYGIPSGNIFFETTRADKLARIATLGCTYFIDDLKEVLEDPQFPSGVTRVLFSQSELPKHTLPYVVCQSWAGIEKLVFCD